VLLEVLGRDEVEQRRAVGIEVVEGQLLIVARAWQDLLANVPTR
jgi:hypothetical protein